MSLLITIIIFAAVIIINFIPDIVRKSIDKKIIIFYSICLSVSFIVVVLAVSNIILPGPYELVSFLLEDVAGLNFN
ncbi:MAG TPA: hypothetical protein H9675_03380 [Firmicutes bacterium]|nr:hypothetical protein [Bacillota bacterium]